MSFPLYSNENVKVTVENFIKQSRIPHAIIIEGDEGTGKSTLALYIATAAVCDDQNRPCGVCKQCAMANARSNPDILYLLPEENKKFISVNQIRTLRQDAFIKPHSAEKKVFIIEDADRMNEQAQNALLKVLEEPPLSVIFILCTSSKTMLLETVQSRCNILSLNVPDGAQAIKAVKELTGVADEEIENAVKKFENNVGMAVKYIGGKAESVALGAAKDFLDGIFNLREYELLKLLLCVCDDRKIADEFFASLKMLIAKDLRKNYKLASRSKILTALYVNTDRYIGLLNKNINLSLLFTALVSDTKHIIGRGV